MRDDRVECSYGQNSAGGCRRRGLPRLEPAVGDPQKAPDPFSPLTPFLPPAKYFVYDSATVNGQAMANAAGRLAEAYTCTGSCTSTVTDLGFSYSPRGDALNVYEKTPNSGGYYNVAATYYANGLTDTLGGVGLPSLTYTPDGEGRIFTVSGGSQNPVTSTTYNLYASPPNIKATLGSTDSDQWNLDPNTGRMTQYSFNVGSKTVQGTLNWNSNGTLQQLAITDPNNSNNQQTCSYTYDDLTRVAGANCGSTWSQLFNPDAFGNLSKSGTISFQPTFNTSNQVYQVGTFKPTYDANGNLTNDGVNAYTWDANGNFVSVSGSYANVGLTFDALDRMVEQNRSGSYTQIVYGPMGGKLALMNGQTLLKGFVPLSGGDTAVYNSSGLAYYRHADWLGSSRLASTPNQTVYYDGAYAPYGENYSETGTTDRSFAGMNQDTVAAGPYPLYDGLYREYHPTWGRSAEPRSSRPGGRRSE